MVHDENLGYDLLDTLSHLLRRSHFHAEKLFAEMLGGHGITSRQLALLVAVAQTPGASQREAARMIALDVNTVSDLVRRMETRGLVIRRVSRSDARSVRIELTAAGHAILAAVHADNAAYQERLKEGLTAEETMHLKDLLRRLLGLSLKD